MSTISENPPSHDAYSSERPSIAEQKAAFLTARETGCAAASEQWQIVADLLDEFVSEYDECLTQRQGNCPPEFHRQLQRVLDGFDLLGSVARTNAEVLDDLASEIILAQARVSTIWTDYLDERSRGNALSVRAIERRFAARSSREVWYPFDGAVEVAARRLQVVAPVAEVEPSHGDTDDASARVVPINRERRS